MGAKPSHPQGTPLTASDYSAGDDAVERFRELLRIATVSREDVSQRNDAAFAQWIHTLQRL